MGRQSLLRPVVIGLAILIVSTVLVGSEGSADALTTHDESAFVSDINTLRATHGLPAFTVDSRLTAMARSFAVTMASSGAISHNPNLSSQSPRDWLKLGENVGVGSDEPSLQQAFVNSPPHYRNLVDADFRSIGVAVVYSGDRTWVVEDFMKSSGPTVPLVASRPTPNATPTDRIERYKAVLREDG